MKRRIVLFLIAAVLMSAGPKTWQLGKFKDAQSGQYEVPYPPNGGALTRAVTLFKNHSYTDYVIESDLYVFVVELKRSAHVILNGEARFATEKDARWQFINTGTSTCRTSTSAG